MDGANVNISMVGFDSGVEDTKILDGLTVQRINSNLTALTDTTCAQRISANEDTSFMGDTKGGAFDISDELALQILAMPNPHGLPNSHVVVPWSNGWDITRRPRRMWIIDFGIDMEVDDAARFEAPFQYVEQHVRPIREKNKRASYREKWWIHVEPRPTLRTAICKLDRFLVTIGLGKHRLFVWLSRPMLPDHQLFAFARSDDFFFGVLHSRAHEYWALRLGTRLESRPRYTATTCFETFPLPGATESQRMTISEAATNLDALRKNWLNPPEWTREQLLEFPGSIDGPWARYVVEPDARGIGTVRYPRLVPKDEEAAKALAKRTLTNLYNERPTWLDLAHKKLDEAVFDAYGWPPDISDDELLAKLLELNLERARADEH